MGTTVFCIDGPLEGQLREVKFGAQEIIWIESGAVVEYDPHGEIPTTAPYILHSYKHRGHFQMPTGEHVPIWSMFPIPETKWKDPAWNEKIVKAYYTIAYPEKYAIVKSTAFADALEAEMNNLLSQLKKEQAKQLVTYNELMAAYGKAGADKIWSSSFLVDSDTRDWLHAGIRDVNTSSLCFGCAEELIGPGMGRHNSLKVPKGKGRRVRQLICSHCGRGRFNRFGKRIGDWEPSKISS